MSLTAPAWLLLAVPSALALWLWGPPTRGLTVLRGVAVALVLLAACGPVLRLPSRHGTVVVVCDRSLSMPDRSDEALTEAVRLIGDAAGDRDEVGVVAFGRNVAVEMPPGGTEFGGFSVVIDRQASRLAEAIETALALIPPERPGRVVVLSDGLHTGADPGPSAGLAAARDIGIDYRHLSRGGAGDVAIQRLDAPASAGPGEAYMLTAWVYSPTSGEASFALRRGEETVSTGRCRLDAGLTRLTFRDKARSPGAYAYRLEIEPEGSDPIPENNRARAMVGVTGNKPLLCVRDRAGSSLEQLLRAGGLDVAAARPEALDWSLESLADYSAVLLENVEANAVGEAGMRNLSAWVSRTGAGLMMTGGRTSYGPGGYFRSPLEEIMPVSMELRREHRKLALAIVVALDRSGSMAVPVPGGRTKMDLANLAAAEVLNLLSPMDEFGCVAVDSSPHRIVDLAPVTDKQVTRRKVLRIESMGGGIYVYEALQASAAMVTGAEAGTRHIILFADAADAEEPGRYVELLARCRRAGITCSVIGLGTPKDVDADLLRDIAKRGGGRCFFTNRPAELPRLFAQDTFVVARSAFIDEATPVALTGGIVPVMGRMPSSQPPAVGGYNLCYLREGANLAAVTRDEYEAPLIATWHAGLGRVACYTGEADGKFTGPIARWPELPALLASQARWAMGRADRLPADMLLTQSTEGGAYRITLHLDPQRQAPPFDELPRVNVLRGRLGEEPEQLELPMRWSSADALTAELALDGPETVLSTVEIPGVGRKQMSPTCLPYSPEHAPRREREGVDALRRIARATGGAERVDLTGVWGQLPPRPQRAPIGRWLYLAAAVVVLLEVVQRRTGLLSAVRLPRRLRRLRLPRFVRRSDRRGRRRPAPASARGPDEEAGSPAPVGAGPKQRETAAASSASSEVGEGDEEGFLDALDRARKRSRDRFDA